MQKKLRRGLNGSDDGAFFRGDALILAALSGFLLFLSFPKFNWGTLSWVAFVPLFWALKQASSFLQAFLLGLVAGVVCYIGTIYWIAYVIINYGYLPLYVGIILMLLLACYLSLYLALFSAFVFYFRNRISLYVTAPVLWICFEYLKSVVLTGFPWENLGYAQYRNVYFIQFADVFGVFGLSFLLIWANVAVFRLLTERTKKEWVAAAMVLAAIAGVHLYGVYRLGQVEKAVRVAETMEVSLVQGNIDQSVKWNPQFQRETLHRYERLSLLNAPGKGSLVVWPETAVPFKFQEQGDLHRQIINLVHQANIWLLFGSVSYIGSQSHGAYYNSAYLLSPEGEIKGKYDKVHLVPYGEYVPLRKIVPFVEGFTKEIGDFAEGAGFFPLDIHRKKIGVLICYEAILAEAAREYKRKGADLLVTISNDAWFGKTSAPFQHFSMMILRAVETRLYLIRAANTGISGIVDPAGRVLKMTEIFKEEALKGEIRFVRMATFYSQHGDVLVLACFLMFLAFFIISLKRGINHVDR